MRYFQFIIVLILPVLLLAQEQVTDIHSTRYISNFECLIGAECIIDGDLDGEPFTVYLGFYQVFIDFENEAISDYNIPYTYGCFRQHIMLNGKYLYILSHGTLVIDIEAGRVHDHFSFGDGLAFRSAERSESGMVLLFADNQEDLYYYGWYNPENKERLLSAPHPQLISFKDEYYFTDSIPGAFLLGKFTSTDWSEEIIIGGEAFTYLGDGFFRFQDGTLIEGLFTQNPVTTCIPQDESSNDILVSKIYNRSKFKILVSYDESSDVYSYYKGDSCDFKLFYSNSYTPKTFDFFGENHVGISPGEYQILQHHDDLDPTLFTLSSQKQHHFSDEWAMYDDTAYLFTLIIDDGVFKAHIIRYTPQKDPLLADNQKTILVLPEGVNVVRRNINQEGNIELTFNNSVDGLFVITYDPNGNQIDRKDLFYSWYYDHDEKNATWTSYKGGNMRINRIKETDKFKIHRVEEGVATTDTMLARPYIDEQLEVSIIDIDGVQILRFTDLNTSEEKDIINPNLSANRSTIMIRIRDEIWIITKGGSMLLDKISRFDIDGNLMGEIDVDVHDVISYDDNGLVFNSAVSQGTFYLFQYDGEEIKQLTEESAFLAESLKLGANHYIFSYNVESTIYEYNSLAKTLTHIDMVTGRLQNTGSRHNSKQTNKSYYSYQPSDYATKINHVLFNSEGYKIEEFDLGDTLFTGYTNTFAYKNGFIYSIRDNTTNVYVDENGTSRDIPIELEEDVLIEDIQQTEESVYLFSSSFYGVSVIKCDSEFADCDVIKYFDQGYCQFPHVALLGKNNGEIYFSTSSRNPTEVIWTIDLSTDEIYLYNNDEETQIQFFERREFTTGGYVYFTAARSDQEYQLFRLKVSEGPNATKDFINENTFEVYPNLTSGNSTITTDLNLEQFSIFDVRGMVVVSSNFDQKGKFRLPDLSSGYYIIRGEDSKGNQYTSKIIVMD